jgi:hypothetical protein
MARRRFIGMNAGDPLAHYIISRPWPPCALKTGKMDVYVGNSNPALVAAGGSVDQIEVEVETNYAAQWAFKGQAQNVNTALRIKYRFPVLGKDGENLYWVTEHLLIGYLGSGAG